jgi:uroporphyrinogen III methyltransferase / synthase
VLFVSSTAVNAFWEEWRGSGRDGRKLAGIRFACCGTATGAALERVGIRPDIAIPTFEPKTLLDELRAHGAAAGAAILFPGELDTPSALANRLSESGFPVQRVEAYRAQLESAGADEVRRQLDVATIHAVAFSSSGTVRSFVAALGADAGRSLVAAIGPETVRTALSLGLPVHVVPGDSSLQGLVDGLAAHAPGTSVAAAEEGGDAARRARAAADATPTAGSSARTVGGGVGP